MAFPVPVSSWSGGTRHLCFLCPTLFHPTTHPRQGSGGGGGGRAGTLPRPVGTHPGQGRGRHHTLAALTCCRVVPHWFPCSQVQAGAGEAQHAREPSASGGSLPGPARPGEPLHPPPPQAPSVNSQDGRHRCSQVSQASASLSPGQKAGGQGEQEGIHALAHLHHSVAWVPTGCWVLCQLRVGETDKTNVLKLRKCRQTSSTKLTGAVRVPRVYA